MKTKVEKDKNGIMKEIQDVRAATDEVGRSKASAEKANKSLITQLNEANKKVEEANLTLADFETGKRKLAAENADLLRQLQEIENSANMLNKLKIQLIAQLDEARSVAENEGKDRLSLLARYKNLEHELDGTREQLDEEMGLKEDFIRQVRKTADESDMWRQKYENDAVAKAEELEMAKMKLQARLSESEGTVEQLNAKLGQIDKAKMKLQSDIEAMAAQLDQAHLLNNSMEKKAKNFDKIVCEWKGKVDSLSMDLDITQKECRNASSELFRVKNAYEESISQLDEVRKKTSLSAMKSKTSWTKLVKEVDLSMNLTKSESAWNVRKWNCKRLWKKQKEPLNKRKTKFFVLNWSLTKLEPKLNVALRKKKKNLLTPKRIIKRL